MGHEFLREGVGHDDLVSQTIGEGACDSVGDWGDETDPSGAEPRGEDGDGDDDAFGELEFLRHDFHELVVGEDVRASDFEDLACGVWGLERADQPVQDIGDRDGLGFGHHP